MRRLQRFELKKTSSVSSFKAKSKSKRPFNVLVAHGERSKEAAGDSSNSVLTGFGIKEEGGDEGSRQRLKTRSSSASWKASIARLDSSRSISSFWSIGKRCGEFWLAITSTGLPFHRLSLSSVSKPLNRMISGRLTSWGRPTFPSSETCI